ncbi:ABC transporter substrate-binding protein [Actinophytocola oryzae]|uniref:Polar amino acid transport system substrate-binding protein n=1 Tax=Actinophytocola oryzae TaxID=502181 RepID=A0A4R7VMB1_9PSEU|nr:ABC transporter substrate-binding protein [Actinophytocola oryzae]TDV50736.1 polar amino acid transport system substrate-binding protein [Actinophytocola oryzae]
MSRTRLSVLTVLCAAATLLAAGCGATTEKPSGDDSAGGGSQCTPGDPSDLPDPKPLAVDAAADSALGAQVPDAIKADGKIVIATDASYAPNEYTLEGSDEIVGMDVDLGKAIGKVLGTEVEFVNASFDGILAGIQANRYELGMSSFTDTKEREQTVDFVTYLEAGTSTMVRKCNPKNINSIEDLCGKKVGAENGTTQLDQLNQEDVEGSVVKACKEAGKDAPVAQGFPKQTDVNAALQANRIDAYMADSPVVDYAVKKTGNAFEKAGDDTDTAPYGIAVPKTGGTFKDAVQAAVQKLIDDGTYKKILDNWGVADGAITEAKVNGAIY